MAKGRIYNALTVNAAVVSQIKIVIILMQTF